jgi:uncharacterized protein YbbC (DUF1343 family)
MIVKTGLEVLREQGYKPLHGQRVGLLTNPSAVDRSLESAYSILCHEESIHMVALFAPEHGFAGALADGEQFGATIDPLTHLPVFSLYGDTLRPMPEMLKDIDVIVCDIQDVGVRYYTFTWTVSHVLEAAGDNDITVVVLDRPNPLGGLRVYGPTLNAGYSSLVGRYPVPVQHGMTLAEMIWMVNETYNPTLARLSIIPCEHYEREMTWEATHLHWVPPSPNMPHLNTLRQYIGACLVEGTNLSEGRGTALPFEVIGAPWIDGYDLARRLNAQSWSAQYGARFRPHTFKPTQSKWEGRVCQGLQVYVDDPTRWRPIEVWLHVIAAIRHAYPDQFDWLPASASGGHHHFDRLAGSSAVREGIMNGVPIADIAALWKPDVEAFTEARKPFLLYE